MCDIEVERRLLLPFFIACICAVRQLAVPGVDIHAGLSAPEGFCENQESYQHSLVREDQLLNIFNSARHLPETDWLYSIISILFNSAELKVLQLNLVFRRHIVSYL